LRAAKIDTFLLLANFYSKNYQNNFIPIFIYKYYTFYKKSTIFAPNENQWTHIPGPIKAKCPTPQRGNLFFSPNLGTEEWALVLISHLCPLFYNVPTNPLLYYYNSLIAVNVFYSAPWL